MSKPTPTTSSTLTNIDKPDDFDRFWQNTLTALNHYPSGFEKRLREKRGEVQHFSVDFNSWQETTIRGYCLHWSDSQIRPLLVYTHGYNGRCDSQWQWAELGFNVFGFDTRGFGRSTIPVNPDGWILTGIGSEETSILRGAVCDYIRAAEIARQMTQGVTLRTLHYGYSFGGAMALMAEALSHSADIVAAGVPSFGWMAGRRKLVKRGSGAEINRFIRQHPEQEPQVMHALSYFDSANFAPLIDKPTLIGVGKQDVVVPAETVYAITGQLNCPHLVREFPYSHSDQPEEQLWQQFDKEWQQMAFTGQLPIT